MEEKHFKIIEEDGLVIFDGSDDYVPEEEIIDDKDELDIEYLLRASMLQGETKSSEKGNDFMVSCGVVLVTVLYVAALCLIYF